MSEVAGEPIVGRSPTDFEREVAAPPSTGWMSWVVILGIVFPILAIGFELLTRICSSFFDVIPTGWHLLLLCLVPAANAATIGVYRRPDLQPVGPVSFLVGTAIGTSLVYGLEFLPMVPLSAIGIIVAGLGLLGFTPYFALIASVICSRRLGEAWYLEGRKRRLSLAAGLVVSVLILGGFLFTGYMTQKGLRLAASKDEATSLLGVNLIKTLGSDSALLRACYDLPTDPWAAVIWSNDWENRPSREQARTVYYRVTGRSFNSVPPPKLFGPRSRMTQDFDWDSDVGGTAVNSIVRNLSMSTSRLDAVVDPAGLTAYTEWTLVFTNASSTAREARAEIALPPGGTVSRLTLWINDEPREAAFGPRWVVRQAYQEVAVVQERDPVLVTTCGPDRILMQCFPVPANGGTMKVRLGITSPLEPRGDSEALFTLPRFVERNFRLQENARHSLMIESPNPIWFGTGKRTDSGFISQTLTDEELGGTRNVIACARPKGVAQVWTPDTVEPERYAVVQSVRQVPVHPPKNIFIVVDGSRMMEDSRKDIMEALRDLPRESRFAAIRAGDTVDDLAPLRRVGEDSIREARDAVGSMDCSGGIDNRPALIEACRRATAVGNAVVIWVHGPQPLTSDARTEQLLQLVERRGASLRIIAVAAADGRNSIISDLERTAVIERLPRRDTLARDLAGLFRGWRSGTTEIAVVRERVPLSRASGLKVSSHVARLWAEDEVTRICRTRDSRKLPDAAALATRYQVVTPVSGAVVLENEEQYKQANLKPADPKSVPSVVPEPAGWVALGLGVALLALVARRKGSWGGRGCRHGASPAR